MDKNELKRVAARAAVEAEVRSGMKLGLGSGSTLLHVVELIGEGIQAGTLTDIVGVPTSEATAEQARGLGIPLLELHEAGELDLALDGADEIDPSLGLIKGLGGAALREKMIAQHARRFVIVADGSKLVQRLGQKAPLPVEVISFGWRSHLPFLEALGARAELRQQGGEPYLTDNHNFILHCFFDSPDGIPDSAVLDWALLGRAGIVNHGLFLDMAAAAYVAEAGAVRRLLSSMD